MDKTILGINLWAYLGFCFLILAGFCSAKAAKSSTKTIVKKGVDDINKSTKLTVDKSTAKILHPVISLYDYLSTSSKPNLDKFLDFTAFFIEIKKQQMPLRIENPSNEQKTLMYNLNSAAINCYDKITDSWNSYNTSKLTLKYLSDNFDNVEYQELLEKFYKSMTELNDLTYQTEEPGFDFTLITNKINQIRSIHNNILELLDSKKNELLN